MNLKFVYFVAIVFATSFDEFVNSMVSEPPPLDLQINIYSTNGGYMILDSEITGGEFFVERQNVSHIDRFQIIEEFPFHFSISPLCEHRKNCSKIVVKTSFKFISTSCFDSITSILTSSLEGTLFVAMFDLTVDYSNLISQNEATTHHNFKTFQPNSTSTSSTFFKVKVVNSPDSFALDIFLDDSVANGKRTCASHFITYT